MSKASESARTAKTNKEAWTEAGGALEGALVGLVELSVGVDPEGVFPKGVTEAGLSEGGVEESEGAESEGAVGT